MNYVILDSCCMYRLGVSLAARLELSLLLGYLQSWLKLPSTLARTARLSQIKLIGLLTTSNTISTIMSAFYVSLTTAFACWIIKSIETSFVVSKPYRTGPTESPTKIISENLSAIFAIGAVYDVKQTKGSFFKTFLKIIFFFFIKTLL